VKPRCKYVIKHRSLCGVKKMNNMRELGYRQCCPRQSTQDQFSTSHVVSKIKLLANGIKRVSLLKWINHRVAELGQNTRHKDKLHLHVETITASGQPSSVMHFPLNFIMSRGTCPNMSHEPVNILIF
jgi:hypothetical protein